MTRSHPVSRAVLGVTVIALTIGLVAGVQAGSVLAAEHEADPASGKAPKQVKGLELVWYDDPAESKQDGAGIPAYGDMVAVGVALTEGNGKVRKQLIKQAGKKDTTVGPATKTGKKDTVANVVVNLAGSIPGKLNSDVVLVVGVDGDGSVPFSAATPDSVTQGAAFAHLIGRYGSQRGAPWLTGDDSLAGAGAGAAIDFDRQGTGAGGYDAKTKSIYTSFILPRGAQHLFVSLYTTKDGDFRTDFLSGPAHTYRVPIHGGAAEPVECAKIDVFSRGDDTGMSTGIYDVRATLVQPVNSTVPASPHDLVFAPGPGASADAGFPPESPAGSGVTYWQGTVDVGSPDGGVFEITAPSATDGLDGGRLPAVLNAFGDVHIHGTPGVGGTAYGDPHCGSLFEVEGCAHGGGADFWGDFAEAVGQPRPTDAIAAFPFTAPQGTAYCVLVPEGKEQPLAVFGIEPRPFTLDGHVRDMEANACAQTPVEIGFGGVVADCPSAGRTYRWLETGVDPSTGTEPGWGFRPEFTIWPAGREVLGWSDDRVPLTPEALGLVRDEARDLLEAAGWADTGQGYDFSRQAASVDTTNDDLVGD